MHDEQDNEEPDEGHLRVAVLPLHVTICDQAVDRDVNDPGREYRQSENEPDDHSHRVCHNNEDRELRIRDDADEANENVADIVDKQHKNANSQRVCDEIRHENELECSKVMHRHEHKVGAARLHQGVHKRVDVVPQLEHVELAHPRRNGREWVVLEHKEAVPDPGRPPLLALEEVEGEDRHGGVVDELPELDGETLHLHLVAVAVLLLGDQKTADPAEEGNKNNLCDGQEGEGEEGKIPVLETGIVGELRTPLLDHIP